MNITSLTERYFEKVKTDNKTYSKIYSKVELMQF